MSGKAYTMKEMKTIVDYLVEHKAYGEIRGRKMWMDFANSKVLTRTWQSLKETFLKRILPDINNPYYKLTLIQIASFRQGSDVEAKLNNKLDLEPVDKSNSENDQLIVNEDVEDDNETETGEATRGTKLVGDRTSTDTLVLENYYANAEEIEKELGTPDNQQNEEKTQIKTNNVIQDVINDFTSDNEHSDEPKQLQNTTQKDENNQKEKENNVTIEILDSEDKIANANGTDKSSDKSPGPLKIDEDANKENPEKNYESKENPNNTSDSILNGNKSKNETKPQSNEQTSEQGNEYKRTSGGVISTTNSTVDTQLPNNPEGLNNTSAKAKASKVQLSLKNENKRNKRATSQDAPKTKRKKIEQQLSVSDTDAVKNLPRNGVDKTINEKDNSTKNQEQESLIQHAQIVNLDTIPDSSRAKDNVSNDKDTSGEIEKITAENTCEKNISLYAKQLSYTIYSDSGNSIEQTDTSKQQTTSNIPNAQAAVLNTNSDSSPDGGKPKTKSVLRIIEKKRRHNALAHALGFSNDVLSSRKRRRSYNRKRSNSRHKTLHISSGTSDYTSESETEFISPPRGRKNRGTRKYLKPKSARILSLEEEGGLFVMHGKKIYPIIKDGKILKNYLTYTPDDDSGKEESFWKLKYVEEKKRSDELAKLLQRATGSNKAIDDGSAIENMEDQNENKNVESAQPIATTSCDRKSESNKKEETVKIKFTKNNKEVQLEGHWGLINNVLGEVVQVLNMNNTEEHPYSDRKETEEKRKRGRPSAQKVPEETKVINEASIPAVANGNEANRVNDIEDQIFKEIEEIDRAEAETKQTESVTTRRGGRPRKGPTEKEKPTENSKKAKLSIDTDKKTDSKKDAPATRRSTRTPKKTLEENVSNASTNKKSSPRKSNKDLTNNAVTEDDDVKYKFPSPRPARRRARNSYAIDTAQVHSSPDNPSYYSEDTTQGYIDSDFSPVCFRRKRRCSILTRKLPSRFRKKPIPDLNEITSESSCSFVTAPLKSKTFTNSSISSHIYRSESYQLLMPNAKFSPKRLTRIDEHSPPKDTELKKYTNDENNNNDNVNNLNEISVEVESSSVSLPTSPVLSIVENISVNKSMLSSLGENSLNAPEHPKDKITLNELMTPDLDDVSMPLMEQNYIVEKKGEDGRKFHYTLNPHEPHVSDSFVNKICTVRIEDITLSESLSTKLRNLLIESAKKFGKKIGTLKEGESVPESEVPEGNTKKTKPRKRSSTPRKKQNVRKSQQPRCEAFVEEEHTELCSQAGRKSCPPVMTVCEDIAPAETKGDAKTSNVNKREKKKKDVIKVKITRPNKRLTNIGYDKPLENHNNSTKENSTNDTESGIFLHGLNDSVDLIHNHSETCLQAHECILNNSVEIVQKSKSVISIDSNDTNTENEYSLALKVDNKMALELLGSDAQDASHLFKDKSLTENTPSISIGNTPAASTTPNSLITDDLSVNNSSPKPNNWYFFSEEETTNYAELKDSNASDVGYGANLNQIFPITCAVPNLSTITEISNENTNSKKINIDEKLMNEIFSQSLFSNQ